MINTPVKNTRDAEDYISRLSKYGIKFEQAVEQMKIREKKGFIPPEVIIDSVIRQMNEFITEDAKNNLLYTTFSAKVSSIRDVSDDKKHDLCLLAEKNIEDVVFPAYKSLYDYLAKLESKAPDEIGVWHLPDGDEYYRYALRHYTTTDLTPEEIYNVGVREVYRLQQEMKKLFKGLGYNGNSIPEGMQLVRSKAFYKQDVIKEYKAIIEDAGRRLPVMFNVLPKSKVKLSAVPSFMETTFPNAYMPGTLDGSSGGTFLINMSMNCVKHRMLPLAYHETLPGHHLQVALQQEMNNAPLFRRVITQDAYAEGWAMYAETLADECDLYSNDYEKLGYLQSQLHRAARLVIDTGIHHRRWTRQEAERYLLENAGIIMPSEIDRYIACPGQACSYMIGELKILELRKRAEEKLGKKFNIKDFHDAILEDGSMPLVILEKQVDKYINEKI
jgi:uncharacterized protein (DUF885 family)